jgi:hypothetical protein
MLSCCSAIFLTHPSTSSPQHFPFPSVAPCRTSAATPGRRRQPPTPPPSPNPVLLEHRRDPLVLPSPSNFTLPHPNIISRSAGELKAPLPPGLAVDPPIQSLLAPAKHTVSTTSSCGSSSTTSPPPSGTLATRTPSTPSELRRPLGFAVVTPPQPLPSPTPATHVTAVSPWSFSPTCPSPLVSPLAGFDHHRSVPLLNPDQGLDCKDSNDSRGLFVENQYPSLYSNQPTCKIYRNL